MERAGEKLKRVRERLKLTFRDVEQASQELAFRHKSDEFAIALSRLADIENKGTLPSIFKIYSLCAIYRLDFSDVLSWYGVDLGNLSAESVHIKLNATHTIRFPEPQIIPIPQPADFEIDIRKTTFLSQQIRRWGKTPVSLLAGIDLRQHRYGFIGMEDWSMYPILHPGALVMIDENRSKIAVDGWINEFERPVYFLEHREGFLCGWCTRMGRQLMVHAHPSSAQAPLVFEFPSEIDVIGQVTGVAMILDSKKRGHSRSAATPVTSPDR